jgi:Sodium/hydrogen exchanger family
VSILISNLRSPDLCVLGKVPLGAFVPRFQPTVPEGFPFNPYIRDVIYASVGMTCRGEFSFVIASFGLSAHLFTTEVYSSVVFAVLLSSITSPFALLTIIRYYNRKSEQLLKHLMDNDAGDGKIPLYLAIQVRTPNQWGLQETIQSAVKRANLVIIDHRSWHPRGVDALVMTELYVEDSNFRLPRIKVKELSETRVDLEAKVDADISSIMETVDYRCASVKKILDDVLGNDEQTRIVVTLWQPHAVHDEQEQVDTSHHSLLERLKNEAQTEMLTHESFGIQLPRHRRMPRNETPSSVMLGEDMWANDKVAQDVAWTDAQNRVAPTALAARYPYAKLRKSISDLTGFRLDAIPSAEDHLVGFVRHDMGQELEDGTPFTNDDSQ